MTGRERVLAALEHREADHVPLDIGGANSCGMNIGAYRNLLRHAGLRVEPRLRELGQQIAWMDEEVAGFLGVDARCVAPPLDPSALVLEEDAEQWWYVDPWGRSQRMPKVGGHYFDTVDFPLADKPLEEYRWPGPVSDARLELLAGIAEGYAREARACLCMPGSGNGFLQMGAQLFGYEDWFVSLLAEPERAEAFMDRLLEYKLEYWERILARFGNLVDVACESDDLGTQSGPWLDPGLWRRLMKPRLATLVAGVKRRRPGIKFFLHSCGAVRRFIPDLIEAGVDILNPVQMGAADMDTAGLKRDFGKDIVFWGGGIDTQRILPRGSPAEVKDEVRRRVADLAPGGGFVFAAVHNIQSDVPPENIVAMVEAVRECGGY